MDDRTQINYEWDVETVDEDGDIQDHFHGSLVDLLASFGTDILTGKAKHRLVLIRTKGNYLDGLLDMQWAYVEGGILPDTFDAGTAVPTRFKKELAQI